MITAGETITRLLANVRAVEFGAPFVVYPLGSFADHSPLFAPVVWHDDGADVMIDGAGWEALTGYTRQHGYRGAVMHASEHLSRAIVSDLWEMAHDSGEPQTFALVVVECLPTDEDPEPEPAGWAIVHYVA